jgi:hypothetical protein
VRSKQRSNEGANPFLRRSLVLWFVQVLVLAIVASLLMFSDASWVDHFERVRLVRNFMANPLEMLVIEAFGTLCLLVGVSGVVESDGSFLDTARGGYIPLFIGTCLILLFIRGLFRPWWLFRCGKLRKPSSKMCRVKPLPRDLATLFAFSANRW